ncbi:MAG: hypothetical protein HC896_19080 [Bacteroidales bacterium]|nr:hypothetical protein [Bacteroidales bacterium]
MFTGPYEYEIHTPLAVNIKHEWILKQDVDFEKFMRFCNEQNDTDVVCDARVNKKLLQPYTLDKFQTGEEYYNYEVIKRTKDYVIFEHKKSIGLKEPHP